MRGFGARALDTLYDKLGAKVDAVYDSSVSEAWERALPQTPEKRMSSPRVLTLEYHVSIKPFSLSTIGTLLEMGNLPVS